MKIIGALIKKFWMPIVLVILVITTAFFGYQYFKLSKDPQKIAQAEVQSLVEKVSKLVVLPTDETPTVATVSDPEALKNQPFFSQAELGDKVLIFTNAQKAVLYRPSVNKIIELAPINIGNNTRTPAPVVPAASTTPATTN